MKILLAGFGSIGRRHLQNLRTLGADDLLLYRSGRSTLPPSNELAGIVSETDLRAALEHRPEVAIIANPTSLHVETALACLQAGCHTFIEKPIGYNLDGCVELDALAKRQNLVVMSGFQFRFHPGLIRLKNWIEEDAVGAIVNVQAHWGEYLPDWHPWEDYRQSYSARPDLGGGVILTLCHPFDYLRWLIGEITEVAALTGYAGGLEISVEDTADVQLQFASGATGHVHLDYVQRPSSHWLQITGREGILRWDNESGAARCYRAALKRWEDFTPPPGFERNTMFLDEMRHFLDCVAEGAEPRSSFADGVRALQIALAAKKSAEEKKTIQL